MLLQFLVSNYGSIKNEVLFSMVPSQDKEHPENILTDGRYKANSLAAIYGANASGKSTLFRAMTNAIIFIRSSNVIQVGQKIPVVPFRFCDNYLSNPTKYEFTFVAEDSKKYVYGYSATTERILEEYLYVYNSSKPSMLFERKEDEYKFPRSQKKNLQPLIRMNTGNKLFLSTATAWNAECTAVPYKWFAEMIDTQTSTDTLQMEALEEYRTNKKENISFVKKLMRRADINITDVEVETEDVTGNDQPLPGISLGGIVINNQIIKPQVSYKTKIMTGHRIAEKNGAKKEYVLPLQEESLGTIQLFYFAPFLKKTLEEGKVLVIDEIDKSLHPYIVKFLVNLFRNKEVNRKGAQLIFTTHDTTLLSLDIFRRDQIYFTEKDSETGISDLYSLDDYSVRKDENIEKGYLLGRYGAIPYLQTEEIV